MKIPRINSRAELFSRCPVVVRLPVQWGEMDSFQHVNNVTYFKYQESSRLKFFKALTDEIKDPAFNAPAFMLGTGLGPILSETHVKFIYPVVYPDTLLVGARGHMVENSLVRFKIVHSIWSLTCNRIVAEGTGTVASFNYATGKVQNFDPLVVEAIQSLAQKDSVHLEEEYSNLL